MLDVGSPPFRCVRHTTFGYMCGIRWTFLSGTLEKTSPVPATSLCTPASVHTNTMNHALREYTRQTFARELGPTVSAKNAEISVLNYAVQSARRLNIDAAWENQKFRNVYKTKVVWLTTELRRPNYMVAMSTVVDGDRVRVRLDLVNQLVYRLRTKELDVKCLAKYPPDILWPDGPYSAAILKSKKKDLEREKAKAAEEDYNGMFTCSRCKSKKTTFYLLQTRSADEPMTAFITCLGCGRKWKG